MSGLFSEPTEDDDGFLNIGWTDVGDWAEYKISVEKSGTYSLNARISASNTSIIDYLVDGKSIGRMTTSTTGGWQNWKTVSIQIELEAGDHILKMLVRDSGFNINWLEISGSTATLPEFEMVNADVYPNPVSNGIISISLQNVIAGSEYFCTLYNIQGTRVFTQNVKPSRSFFQLNLNKDGKLNAGVYYLNITGKNTQAKQLLVVQ
jgi:hypothetical protein